MDAQQKFFTALKLRLEALGFDVYDEGLPPEGTPYPFVYLGDSQQNDTPTKGAMVGNVRQTIHIWHNNPKQRGTVSAMMLAVKKAIVEIESASPWIVVGIGQTIFEDKTTKTPLLHGVVTPEIKYS